MRTLTIPPSQDEVAQAADEISGGALAGVRVEPWPRGRSHHAYVLTTPGGEKFLFKVHRRPHAGRMRRFLHLADLLKEKRVPHPAVRWYDVDKQTLDVPYYIQDFITGEEVLDVIGNVERLLIDVVPADRRVRHALLLQEVRQVKKPAHPSGVRASMDLEEELLASRRREHVCVMRPSARPRLDANSGERAARDLVRRLSDLVLRRRD